MVPLGARFPGHTPGHRHAPGARRACHMHHGMVAVPWYAAAADARKWQPQARARGASAEHSLGIAKLLSSVAPGQLAHVRMRGGGPSAGRFSGRAGDLTQSGIMASPSHVSGSVDAGPALQGTGRISGRSKPHPRPHQRPAARLHADPKRPPFLRDPVPTRSRPPRVFDRARFHYGQSDASYFDIGSAAAR